jgi:hypothetical protein
MPEEAVLAVVVRLRCNKPLYAYSIASSAIASIPRSERLGGFDVNSHLKFGPRLNQKLRRVCGMENAIDISR